MTAAESFGEALDEVLAAVEGLAEMDMTEWDRDEAIVVWDKLDALAVLARGLAHAHGAKLARTMPEEYEHPSLGPLHTGVEVKVKWDGAGVLSALTKRIATYPDGEIMEVVPTDTLRRVIPAVGKGKTSSNWNKTGLLAVGIQPSMYSETDYGARTLRRGPKYQRGGKPPP